MGACSVEVLMVSCLVFYSYEREEFGCGWWMVTFPPVPLPATAGAGADSDNGSDNDNDNDSDTGDREEWGADGRWHIDGEQQ